MEHNRSLYDAISLVRNIHDQGTVYYQKDKVQAVYDVCPRNYGTMIVNGHVLTFADVPQDWDVVKGQPPTNFAIVSNLKTATNIFEHNNIDVNTGWDIKP